MAQEDNCACDPGRLLSEAAQRPRAPSFPRLMRKGWESNPLSPTPFPQPAAYSSSAATLGIHSLIGIFCGHASSQMPQSIHWLARSASLRKTL